MSEKDVQTDTHHAIHIEDTPKNTQDDVDIAPEAKGGKLDDMPPGYYRSWRFIGTVAAVVFMAQGLYLGSYIVHVHV